MATISIPITKAGEYQITIDTDKLPEHVFKYALARGLKELLNRGMTKVTVAELPDETKRQSEAKRIADINFANVMEGKIRQTGGVKQKVASAGPINTEAMRLARLAVKDMIKAAGKKISHYAASTITASAKELIATDPSYLEQAKANVEARTNAKPPTGIDVAKIAVSAKKVADAEKAAARKKETAKDKPLSAKQAGQTKKVAPKKGDKPQAKAPQASA